MKGYLVPVLLLLLVFLLSFTGTLSEHCPSYCNQTGHFIEVEDCGDMGYCCGSPTDRTCCTDYFEHLYDLPGNLTVEECSQVREKYLAGLNTGHVIYMSANLLWFTLTSSIALAARSSFL